MLRTHRITALAVVALALLAVRPLPAQFTLSRGSPTARPNPSHLQLRGDPATADGAEDLLNSRLSSLPALKDVDFQRAREKFLANPNFLRQLQDEMAKRGDGKSGATNSQLAELIEKLVKEHSQGSQRPLDPDVQERLTRSLFDRARKGEFGKSLKPEPREGRPRRDPTGERMPAVPKPPPPTGSPAARPREGRNNPQMAQYANQAASWLNRMGVNTEFTRSASWQKLVDGLNGVAREGDGVEGGDSWLKRFGLDLNPTKWFSSESWNFRLQLPRASLPNLSRLVPSFPQGGGISVGTPGLPGAPSGGVWRGLLWLVLAVVLCSVGWLLLSRRKGTAAEPDDSPGRKLGPWPVRPQDVRSREDLIRAFEYLSLLRLGFEAQNWNHLQIADALALDRGHSELARAAQSLAGAYEQARYAPPQQALSAAELHSARRDLCLLAGVAAA